MNYVRTSDYDKSPIFVPKNRFFDKTYFWIFDGCKIQPTLTYFLKKVSHPNKQFSVVFHAQILTDKCTKNVTFMSKKILGLKLDFWNIVWFMHARFARIFYEPSTRCVT